MRNLAFDVLRVALLMILSFPAVSSTGIGPAVGFSLALDYGVASIRFSNHSKVHVAKIEGGPGYKLFMHSQLWEFHSDGQNDLSASATANNEWAYAMRIPPWLNGAVPKKEDEPLCGMLSALKTATEAYLDSRIDQADVAFPLYAPASTLESLRSVSSRLRLKMLRYKHNPAGILAAIANNVTSECNEEYSSARLFMALDYDRAALTALISSEECGVYEILHGIHDTGLGSSNSKSDYHQSLVHKLRELLAGSEVQSDDITALVLVGESVEDTRLSIALREVFGADAVARLSASSSEESDDIGAAYSPVFAAADGLAALCMEFRDEDWHGDL